MAEEPKRSGSEVGSIVNGVSGRSGSAFAVKPVRSKDRSKVQGKCFICGVIGDIESAKQGEKLTPTKEFTVQGSGLTLGNVLFVKKLKFNLLSLSHLLKAGINVDFKPDHHPRMVKLLLWRKKSKPNV